MHPFVTVFGVRLASYGLLCAFGVICALVLMTFLSFRHGYEFNQSLLLFLVGVVGGFIGAAIMFIFVTYSPAEFLSAVKSGAFSFGFVFYGGLIAGSVCVLLTVRWFGFSPELPGDVLIPALPLGHAFGRIGCFLAGCCYGKASDGILSVTFPFMSHSVLPVQLFESAAELLICIYLTYCSLKGKRFPICRYIFLYAPVRFVLEFLRGDEIRGRLSVFSTSQWISLVLLAGAAVYMLFAVKKSRES